MVLSLVKINKEIKHIIMNKIVSTMLAMLLMLASFSTTASAAKKNSGSVAYTVLNNYYHNNNAPLPSSPLITTQKEFDEQFGTAAYMGKGGLPTKVNFKRQAVLAIVLPQTNKTTVIDSVSVKVTGANQLTLAYTVHEGAERGYTTQPMQLMAIDKKYGKYQVKVVPTVVKDVLVNTEKYDFVSYVDNRHSIHLNVDYPTENGVLGDSLRQFINNRLEKINSELGTTENQLESYKKRNKVIEMKLNATAAIANADTYTQKLQEANTQVELLKELGKYMDEPGNKYKPIPSNVGLTDESSTELINQYNKIALERSNALHSASELSPSVTPLTAQLEELTKSIKRAMRQARLGMEIQRNSIASQANQYNSQIGNSPEQERVLTQIGRQQEVKSGLYLMLLQKREENSISLAATADKGKIIDAPSLVGKTSPKAAIILLIALVLGFAIPAGILFLIEFFKYKIEGHADVVKLTQIPVIADIPVASDVSKGRADIVVHQNVNNLMEEIFRGLRTSIQFMLKKDEKVLMFTSSTSGEGKTFVASNVAISLALLGKKVIVVGLDIRKPRLAELFEIDNHHTGITNLMIHENNTWEDIQKQILSSGVNSNLDLLMAGPVPPNPGELITRPSLDAIIKELKNHYDYIVLDTAPVGLVNDSLQLGRLANLCIYVCRADYTPKTSFGMINGLNAEKKLPNMCLVLNGVDLSKKKHSFYYGVGKYGKYGKYGNYGNYGNYGKYGSYGQYGSYGNYSNSHYGNANDTSIKK